MTRFLLGALISFGAVTGAAAQGTPAAPSPAPARAKPAADFTALAARADAAREANRLDEALTLYTQALKLRPRWPEGRWHRGAILYELDRHEEARAEFRAIIAGEPKHSGAYALKGLCEFELKHYDRALDDLQVANELGIQNPALTPVVKYHLGILLSRAEQFESAIGVLQEFAARGTDTTSVVEALGIAALRMPLLPSELPAEQRQIVLMAGRATYNLLARQPEAARRGFEELVERYPSAPNVHYVYGVYLRAGSPEKALEAFKRELDVSPGHVPSLVQLALEYLQQGDAASALVYGRQAVEVAPLLAASRKVLGDALLASDDVQAAIAEYELGVKLGPEVAPLRFALARAYRRAGREADAKREHAEFLKLENAKRARQYGEQSVGGIDSAPADPGPQR